MPESEYFKGHGSSVKAAMVKKHGKKVGKRMFYATANEMGMTPKSNMPNGVKQSPMGDLGQHRGVEAKIAGGGFKGAKITSASRYFTKGR